MEALLDLGLCFRCMMLVPSNPDTMPLKAARAVRIFERKGLYNAFTAHELNIRHEVLQM